MIYAIASLAVIAGSFVAGTLYGRTAEAKAIATALTVRAKVDAEYKAIVAKIKGEASYLLARLKKAL